MSFEKVAELAEQFTIKYAENAPADKKASDFSPSERDFINSIAKKDNNQAQDYNDLDEKIWNRAKKTVKKYWKKYEEPWAVVYDVYRKMGGKAQKKKKKSNSDFNTLLQKYATGNRPSWWDEEDPEDTTDQEDDTDTPEEIEKNRLINHFRKNLHEHPKVKHWIAEIARLETLVAELQQDHSNPFGLMGAKEALRIAKDQLEYARENILRGNI